METFFEANLPINKNRRTNPNFVQPAPTVLGYEYTTGASNTGAGTTAGDVQKTLDNAEAALGLFNKVGEGFKNFKDWAGWGDKRYSELIDVYYFWKNGAGQPNEGRVPKLEKASRGWVKDVYEKDLKGDLGALSLEDASKYWPFYADLLPWYDKNKGGLKSLFEVMYQDISRSKGERNYIRTSASYPLDKVTLPDPKTAKDILDGKTTGSGTGSGTGTGTGTGGNVEKALGILDKLSSIFLGKTDPTGKTPQEVAQIEASKKNRLLLFGVITLLAVIAVVFYLRNKKS